MKKLDMTGYIPTKIDTPKIGWDDPTEVEKICQKCTGVIPVMGRVYCVTGVKWCSCNWNKTSCSEFCSGLCGNCIKLQELDLIKKFE